MSACSYRLVSVSCGQLTVEFFLFSRNDYKQDTQRLFVFPHCKNKYLLLFCAYFIVLCNVCVHLHVCKHLSGLCTQRIVTSTTMFAFTIFTAHAVRGLVAKSRTYIHKSEVFHVLLLPCTV